MANKGKRLIPENELRYLETVIENNPDPTDIGGGSEIAAGTGITITTESDDTKTISVDTDTVALKTDIPTVPRYYTHNICVRVIFWSWLHRSFNFKIVDTSSTAFGWNALKTYIETYKNNSLEWKDNSVGYSTTTVVDPDTQEQSTQITLFFTNSVKIYKNSSNKWFVNSSANTLNLSTMVETTGVNSSVDWDRCSIEDLVMPGPTV